MNQSDSELDWKSRHREAAEESLRFFSNVNKPERERWVVRKLLNTIDIAFEDEELQAAEEPVDVEFRGTRFQVKEILDDGRRRTAEYKEQLKRIDDAGSEQDLLTSFSPQVVTFQEATREAYEFAQRILHDHSYGNREISQMDLLIYFDKLDVYVQPSSFRNFPELEFRSLSFVSNGPCGVLYCRESTPDFLIDLAGQIRDGTVL